jgi:hypothetical protein
MKLKFDFITNSSSTSFILAVHKNKVKSIRNSIKKFSNKYKESDGASESLGAQIIDEFRNKDELDNYTNDNELDWVEKAIGPRYENFSEHLYSVCKESIENDQIILYVWADENIFKEFTGKYSEYIIGVNGVVQ